MRHQRDKYMLPSGQISPNNSVLGFSNQRENLNRREIFVWNMREEFCLLDLRCRINQFERTLRMVRLMIFREWFKNGRQNEYWNEKQKHYIIGIFGPFFGFNMCFQIVSLHKRSFNSRNQWKFSLFLIIFI